MRKNFGIAAMALLILGAGLLAGCGEQKGELSGKWGYIHDPETVILSVKDNGKAVYKGEKYDAQMDGTFLTLTDADGETLRLRYTKDEKEFYLYEPCTYNYMDEGTPDGLLGNWYDPDTRWSFEFTDSGTFIEDGYFPGYYEIDETNGVIHLVYNDHFYDTTLYYRVEGSELTIEYPWSMVKAQ